MWPTPFELYIGWQEFEKLKEYVMFSLYLLIQPFVDFYIFF
jgi:hypothetical protein